jgi:ELWxxDGT repeat protein
VKCFILQGHFSTGHDRIQASHLFQEIRSMAHPRRLAALLLLLAAAASTVARAQTAFQVRDIAPGFDSLPSSQPAELYAVKDKVVFAAEEPSTGREVWASDGTPAGTHLLQDLEPGPRSGSPFFYGTARNLVFWGSRRDAFGDDLWSSDGTRSRTLSLMPDDAEVSSRNAGTFAFARDTLFFIGCRTTTSYFCTLWRSDGTPAGTRQVPGAETIPPNVLTVTAAGDRVFVTSVGPFGNTLWISDGTAAGTRPAGPLSGQPSQPTAAGSRLFWIAPASGGGADQLWAGDATGTRALTAFATSDALRFTTLRGGADSVTFPVVADGWAELWKSDGTPAGTRRLVRLHPTLPQQFENPVWSEAAGRTLVVTTDDSGGARLSVVAGGALVQLTTAALWSPPTLVTTGGHAFFFADDGAHGSEPWVTDGTPAGTRLLADTCRGTCGTSGPAVALGDTLYFWVGMALWKSDGTPAGTRKLFDTCDGACGGSGSLAATGTSKAIEGGSWVAEAGGKVFAAPMSPYGAELWVRDATGGSRIAADITRGGASGSPSGLLTVGDRLWLSACDGRERRLWRTTAAGDDVEVLPVLPGDCFGSDYDGFPSPLATLGSTVFFQQPTPGESTVQLWRTDGTAAGTFALTSFGDFGSPKLGQTSAAVLHGKLLFPVETASGDEEIWESDGTPEGTRRAFGFPERVRWLRGLTTLNGVLYLYSQRLDTAGSHLWRSDGTAAGTRKMATTVADGFDPPQFFALGSDVWFAATNPWSGQELWRTDGTPLGAAPFADLEPGAASSWPHDLTAFQGALYFLTSDTSGHGALWRSDGSVAGTVRVQTLPSWAGGLTAAGGRLFFVLDDGVHGAELWTSNGTAAGAALVRDIAPGRFASLPALLTSAGGKLYFVATDRVHGFELWTSDGTAAGTRLVQDIAPEGISAAPDRLTVAGDRLYFTADDGESGRELWALPLTTPSGCRASSTRLCLDGGRYQVEASWSDFEGQHGRGTAVALTADTGYFWFFSPENVEAIVKVLDGRGVNGHTWVFYGALSNVEYTLTVTDTETGLTRRYFNPSGQFASVGDTLGFGPLGAYSANPAASAASTAPPSPLPLVSQRTAAATAPCQPGAERLCLNGSRFAVEVAWKDFQGRTGKGKAVPLSADTGTFWFFDAANVELVVKALDGRAVNDHFWLFYGALSNVEYTLTVTDTETGAVKTYRNPSGRFASVGDTQAF